MSTTSVTSSYWKEPTSTEAKKTTGNNNLSDFNSFVKLLATELQNQDPSDPVSNTEYVAQMAQMSTLQQMQNMSQSISASQAYSMIGNTVTYQTKDDTTGVTTTHTGTVDSVTTKDGKTYLNIDGSQIDLSSVIQVSKGTTTEEQLEALNKLFNKSQAYSMIGATVTYKVTDATSGITTNRTGVVSAVSTKDDKTYLNIDGNQVDLNSVVKVSVMGTGE